MNILENIKSGLISSNFEELIAIATSGFEQISASADFPRFFSCVNALPEVKPSLIDFGQNEVTFGQAADLTGKELKDLEENLRNLIPWRKGPFNLFGINIDAEWRSDLKFSRLEKSRINFTGKSVLDIGSGNGYYMFRLLGKGAESIVGIEPYLLNFMQFNALKKFAPAANAVTLPVGIEALPENYGKFDAVLSMGVFYHRKSPFEHLAKLRSLLRPGGEIVLETLVIEGKKGEVLVPENRYAKMRNVWFIPSVPTLTAWLKRAKFRNISVIDVSKTTSSEQRKTDWMPWESLSDFLDKENPEKTVEGYPAPKRAMIRAAI